VAITQTQAARPIPAVQNGIPRLSADRNPRTTPHPKSGKSASAASTLHRSTGAPEAQSPGRALGWHHCLP
jgi:hypothetical protein